MDRIERRENLERSLADYLQSEAGLDQRAARVEAKEVLEDAGESAALFARRWWLLLVRGLLALVVGAAFLARPTQALATLVWLLGAWVFVDGVATLVGAIAHRRSWHLALEGVIGGVIGYLVLTRPAGASIAFVILVAMWAMARGVTEIAFGANLRKGTSGRGWIVAFGIISFLFGILLLLAPLYGAVALGLWLGFYALGTGLLLVVLSFQVRRVKKAVADTRKATPETTPKDLLPA